MGKTKIICDSGCDLTLEQATALGVERVPLYTIKGTKSFRDGIDIMPSEQYADMRQGAIYTTSQVPIEVFSSIFEEYAKDNIDCLYIAFSSELSGTFNAGKLACEMAIEKHPNFNMRVIDTKCASLGCAIIVDAVARLANGGASLDELYSVTESMAKRIGSIFTVDDVSFLARGGRLSKSSAFFASALDIKPLIEVTEQGQLNPIKKVRGTKKAYAAIVEYMREQNALQDKTVWIGHADSLDKAMAMRDMIAEELGISKFQISELGAVIGTHTGPGSLTVFFEKE
ncbi:MAG: DegV family protein [Eubacteriaceae bacterium]|nr:DegV family protein [Eubacteriaceae bacterium]